MELYSAKVSKISCFSRSCFNVTFSKSPGRHSCFRINALEDFISKARPARMTKGGKKRWLK